MAQYSAESARRSASSARARGLEVAEADRDRGAQPVAHGRLGDRTPRAVGPHQRLMAVALDEDHAVLVGAQAREDVLLAQRAAQQRADLHEHLVGHVQAGAVVEVAEAVDVEQGDGQRAVVALGARDLLGQPLAEGAVVGQAGERVRRRLGVQAGAVLGVGHGGGDEVGVVLQALLGAGGELVRVAGHDDERAPHRGAVAHRRGESHAAVLAVHPVARDGARRSAGGRAGCPGAHRRWPRGLRRRARRGSSGRGRSRGRRSGSGRWRRSRRPADARHRARRARRSPAGGDPAATAVATRRSEDCSSVIRRWRASSSRARRVAPASSSRPAMTTPPTRK